MIGPLSCRGFVNTMISIPLDEMDTVGLNETLIVICVSFNVRLIMFEDIVVFERMVFRKGRRGRKARHRF
jgi:hypothetical protein